MVSCQFRLESHELSNIPANFNKLIGEITMNIPVKYIDTSKKDNRKIVVTVLAFLLIVLCAGLAGATELQPTVNPQPAFNMVQNPTTEPLQSDGVTEDIQPALGYNALNWTMN